VTTGPLAAAPSLPKGSLALVIGAGVSGLGAAQYLAARGFKVRVSERGKVAAEKLSSWSSLGVDLRDGGHDASHLEGVSLVVLSPGLPAQHPLLLEARARRVPLVSEIDLALAEYDGSAAGSVLAVTGTNGKSTTCAMLGHLIAKAGASVEVGGNFGDPPTAMLAAGRRPAHLVLELSSYQLEQSDRVRPKVAVFTSFSHDHLARHGSISGYLAAKWRVFSHLPKDGIAVVPDYVLEAAAKDGLQKPKNLVRVARDGRLDAGPGERDLAVVDGILRISAGGRETGVTTVDLKALGLDLVHNQLNAAFALVGASHVLSRGIAELAPLLEGFQGLAHRCEVVGRRGPHALINDSKSTNVESTLVALASQDARAPVHLMMGGQGKGEPYAPILTERSKFASLITFGATGPEIAAALRPHLPGVPVREFPTLRAALAALSGILEKEPRPVLFSPGCASFDEFKNYEERGQVFRAAVAPLLSR
jgi:UDP-N-acetylmuramoylalanine--D-glutamate ligase